MLILYTGTMLSCISLKCVPGQTRECGPVCVCVVIWRYSLGAIKLKTATAGGLVKSRLASSGDWCGEDGGVCWAIAYIGNWKRKENTGIKVYSTTNCKWKGGQTKSAAQTLVDSRSSTGLHLTVSWRDF